MITRVEDPSGRVILERSPGPQVIDQNVADNVNLASSR